MRGFRPAIGLLAVAILPAILTACSLASLFYPQLGYPSFDPSMSFGPEPAMGTLRHGTATITITSGEPRTVEITHLSGSEPSMVLPGLGAFVAWRTGDWALQVMGDTSAGGFGGAQRLTITREDTDPPLQADGSRCTITYSATTSTHVAGRAECTGLMWADPFGGDPMDLPRPTGSPSSGRPPFDATITFDATP